MSEEKLFPCYVCKVRQPRSNFYKAVGRSTGIGGACKPCAKIEATEWRKNNIETARLINLASNKRHPETLQKWRDKNPNYMNQYMKQWRLNRNNNNISSSCYIPKRKPLWANQFIIREAYRLAKLRSTVTGIKWHVDHIIPLNSNLVSGLHVENNLSIIPAFINRQKGNRYWPDMPEIL